MTLHLRQMWVKSSWTKCECCNSHWKAKKADSGKKVSIREVTQLLVQIRLGYWKPVGPHITEWSFVHMYVQSVCVCLEQSFQWICELCRMNYYTVQWNISELGASSQCTMHCAKCKMQNVRCDVSCLKWAVQRQHFVSAPTRKIFSLLQNPPL